MCFISFSILSFSTIFFFLSFLSVSRDDMRLVWLWHLTFHHPTPFEHENKKEERRRERKKVQRNGHLTISLREFVQLCKIHLPSALWSQYVLCDNHIVRLGWLCTNCRRLLRHSPCVRDAVDLMWTCALCHAMEIILHGKEMNEMRRRTLLNSQLSLYAYLSHWHCTRDTTDQHVSVRCTFVCVWELNVYRLLA